MICSCTWQHGPSWGCWRGGSYSHIVYTRSLERLEYVYCSFIRCIPNTPFGEKPEDSAPLLRVLLLFLSVKRLHEEALKLSENFLITLPMFSKKGLQRCWWTCWIFPCNMDCFVPSYLFGGSLLFSLDCMIIKRLSGSFIFRLFVPGSPCSLGVFPKFSEGLLRDCERRLMKSSPFLLFPSSNDR